MLGQVAQILVSCVIKQQAMRTQATYKAWWDAPPPPVTTRYRMLHPGHPHTHPALAHLHLLTKCSGAWNDDTEACLTCKSFSLPGVLTQVAATEAEEELKEHLLEEGGQKLAGDVPALGGHTP